MLQETQENLGQTVTDKGYRGKRSLGEAAEEGHSVTVNLFDMEGEEASAYHISRFEHEAPRQVYPCPCGVEPCQAGRHESLSGLSKVKAKGFPRAR